MYLLAPTGFGQLADRANWFKSPIARRLRDEKGVEFGFELKGEAETIIKNPGLFWGYHIPTNFAEEYFYHPERREKLVKSLLPISKLKPNYVNVHGPKLWWKPEKKDYIKRYEVHSDPEEFFKLLSVTIDLIKNLQEIFPQLTLENNTLVDYYRRDKDFLPITSFQPSAGGMLENFYIKEKTGVKFLVDIEHLILCLNFLNRKKNYADLKNKKFLQTPKEKELEKIFGYKIKKGYIPYTDPELNFEKIIQKMDAKRYHVTGNDQDVISGEKDLSHGPIKKDNLTFRKHLKIVLKQKPESILVETANCSDNACFSHLKPNETEFSFYNLCQILLEEL